MTNQAGSKAKDLNFAGFNIPTQLVDFPALPRPGAILTMEQEQAFGFSMLTMTLIQLQALACDLGVVEGMLDEIDASFTKGNKADKAVALVRTRGHWLRNGSVDDEEFSRIARANLAKVRSALNALKRLNMTERDLFYVSALSRLRSALANIVPYDMIMTKANTAFKSKCGDLNQACKALVVLVSSEMHISKPAARKVCENYWLSGKLGSVALSSNRYVESIMPAKDKREFRMVVAQHQQFIAQVALRSSVPVTEVLASWSAFNVAGLKMDRMAGTFAQFNTRLAEKVASQYRFATDYDQVRSAAFQGLARAIGLYAPEKGLKFSTYAVQWIKQIVLRDLIQQEIVRLPEGSHQTLTRIRAVYADIPSASDGYVCAAANVTMFDLDSLRPYLTGTGALSMDVNPNDEDAGAGLHTLLTDENNNFAKEVEKESDYAYFIALVKAALTEREYFVMKHRNGLDGAMQMTAVEVGALLDTSPQNISRTEKTSQAKIAAIPGIREVMESLGDD